MPGEQCPMGGKCVIVTGAGGTVGRGIALGFLRAGASVVIADRNLERALETQQLAAGDGFTGSLVVGGDVTLEADIESLVAQAVARFGRLDVMINNAGGSGALNSLLDITEVEFDASIALLLRSVFFGIKHAGRTFRKQGHGGVILTTASSSAYLTGISPSLYAMCKTAIVRLTQVAARELASEGIRVNSVSPGTVWGEGFAALGATEQTLVAEQLVETPIMPDDVAQAMIWLASDRCRQATGTDFLLDGGMIAKGSDFNERVILAGIEALRAEAGNS